MDLGSLKEAPAVKMATGSLTFRKFTPAAVLRKRAEMYEKAKTSHKLGG
jgi:hypothetical protein